MGACGEEDAERHVLPTAGAVPPDNCLNYFNMDPKQHICFSCSYAVQTIPSS